MLLVTLTIEREGSCRIRSQTRGSGREAGEAGVQHTLDRGTQAGDGEGLDEVGGRAQLEYLGEGRQDAHAHDRRVRAQLAQPARRLQMGRRRGLEHEDVRPRLLALAEADVAHPTERVLDQLPDVVFGMLEWV